MKRASILVVTLVMALSMAVALCGCTSNNYTPQAKEQTISNSALKSSGTLRAQSSSMSAWEVTDHYGESCLRNSADLQGAFESLQTGSVNYVAADSTIGAYVVHSSSVEAYPVALLQDPSSYCIAAPTTNVELQKAVSEALGSLKNGAVISVIQKKW